MLARFDKQDENVFMLEDIELFNNLGNNQNLTQNGFDKTCVRFQLEHHKLNQEMMELWIEMDEFNSRTLYFSINNRNGRFNLYEISIEFPLRSYATLNIGIKDEY